MSVVQSTPSAALGIDEKEDSKGPWGAFNVTSDSEGQQLNISAAEEPSGRDEDVAKVEVAVLAVIFILALASNGLVLVALGRQLRRKPSSRMYRLMYHLSIADLLVALLNILPQLIWDITYRFRGPDFLCRTVKFGQIFPLYLSSFLLTLMAVDRVGVTRRASAVQQHPQRALRPLIQGAWALAVLFSLPNSYVFAVKEVSKTETDCWAHFHFEALEIVYLLFFLFLVFFLPFLVITASYCIVTYRIWSYSRVTSKCYAHRSRNMDSAGYYLNGCSEADNEAHDEDETAIYEMKVLGVNGALQGQARRRKDKKTAAVSDALGCCDPCGLSLELFESFQNKSNKQSKLQSSCKSISSTTVTTTCGLAAGASKGPSLCSRSNQQLVLLSKAKRKSLEMTAIVSICFAVCWMPYCVMNLLWVIAPEHVDGRGLWTAVLTLLASLNSTTNPWIYLCFSSAVLQQVKHLVGLRSTLGGPDSLGGADADRAVPQQGPTTKRILFNKRAAAAAAAGIVNNRGASSSGGSGMAAPEQNGMQTKFGRAVPPHRSGYTHSGAGRVRSEPVIYYGE